MRTVDLVGNNGGCNGSDLSGFASLIGTHCCTLSDPNCVYTGGPKYTPIVDYYRDGTIDGTDLALLAAHLGHHCGQWSPSLPSKTSMEDYPWEVLEWPEMKAAMAKAGVDRDFIVSVWYQNGPEQRLFTRPNHAHRQALVAAALKQQAQGAVAHKSWGGVKILYR